MKIIQFEDKGLSHYSYAILSEGEIALVDPARNIRPYLDFANQHQAKIKAVIETHPHADFISGHQELHAVTGATLYCSKWVGASYPHVSFDEGDAIRLGTLALYALNTPGHSPDSISVVVESEGKKKAVFTGDTLFIGDCGRPDLRENVGNLRASQKELAKQMYRSLREKLLPLPPEVIVYPAHGAGTLCGKALREANQSTMGEEKEHNWSLGTMSEKDFVQILTSDQPFIPYYFRHDVEWNKRGVPPLEEALSAVPLLDSFDSIQKGFFIVDGRPGLKFKKGHLPRAFNIQNGGKFETWLGSVLKPEEKFYLVGSDLREAKELVYKAAKIGYEQNVLGILADTGQFTLGSPLLDLEEFKKNPEGYTIVDVRNASETKTGKAFEHSLLIPLPELRDRLSELPLHKPIVVHCAGGYRSAIGSSLLAEKWGNQVPIFDLGEKVKEFAAL